MPLSKDAPLLSPSIVDHQGEHHRTFTSAEPFRRIVFDELLRPAFCRRLMDQFPDQLASPSGTI